MIDRTEILQSFIDAARDAFDAAALSSEARRSVSGVFGALTSPGHTREGPGSRLPVCSGFENAIQIETDDTKLLTLADRFRALEPKLTWDRKTIYDDTASPNFDEGHANTMIVGPGGLEQRSDVWIGATLMAPNVRYPDHSHPPEEVYLVLTPGEFRQGSRDWFAPGIGGSLYNLPGITHAMRSVDVPFLAFWALSAGGIDADVQRVRTT